MTIYHVTKVPLKRSSRVSAQCGLFPDQSVVIDIYTIYTSLRKIKGETIIFHQQASLFYLFYAILLNFFYSSKNKNNIIYDMHDLIIFDHGGIKRYLRAFFILFLERAIMLFDFKIITVSVGLADLIKRKYNKEALVVYNFPLNFANDISCSYFDQRENNNKICYFGIIDEKRIPLDIFRKVSFSCNKKIDIFGYVSPISKFKVEDFDFLNYKGAFSPNNMDFLTNYSVLLFATDQELNLNYKYCMPNKVFQAVAYNLDLYISEFYEEINKTFKNCRVDDKIANQHGLIRLSSSKMKSRLVELQCESNKNFLKVIG